MNTTLELWAAASLLAAAALIHWLARRPNTRDLMAVVLIAVPALIAAGYLRGEHAASERQAQLREMVEGFAPTYALELSRHGHARIGLDTDPGDPTYLELLDMQRRWLSVNPAVADVYTFRRLEDGSVALLVDSETDYDRNGRFEGDRESRTDIGEVYDEPDPEMIAALDGQYSFSAEPGTDRWGTWVSAFVPMLDEDGRVEAVCGVDYPAAHWVQAADDSRVAVYSRLAVLQLLLLAAAIWLAMVRSERARRTETEADLRVAIDEARAGQRAKSQFLATMSHEIRTPMNGVLGMAELLLGTELTREQRQFTRTIHDSGLLLLHVINDILDFSRGEAGHVELELAPCDLLTSVEEVVGMLGELAQRKGIELALVPGAELADSLLADATRLKQVVTNLVGNAIKFTDVGEIAVELSVVSARPAAADGPGTQRIRLAVRDSGIGIPPEARTRIFEAFTQADGTSTRRFGGTGLGLAICKQLVEQMGGTIGVESEMGVGSTFWFEIDLPVVAARSTSALEDAASVAGRYVLVVDDNATNREVVRRHLEAWRMRAVECASGPEALGLLRAAAASDQRFDAAVVDLMMPGMDGLELTRTIRSDAALAGLPIVMLTSLAVTGRQLEEARVTARVTKPVRRSELYNTLVEAMVGQAAPGSAGPERARGKLERPVRVLVVEDNPVNQRVTLAMLKRIGCATEIADTGQAAIDRVGSAPFDLVLMDLMLPGMDGLEATRKIRASLSAREAPDAEGLRLPIVAVTAHAGKEDRDECLAAGMDDWLPKPFTLDQLLARLERWLPWAFTAPATNPEERA